MSPRSSPRPSPHARITEIVLEQLRAGVRPWSRPWSDAPALASALPLRANGAAYQGVNVLLLWCAALSAGYRSPRWMTYRQARACGGQVRKGERGATVVFAKTIRRDDDRPDERVPPVAEPDDARAARNIRFLKLYTVFNAEQIDGLPARFAVSPAPPGADPDGRTPALDAFFARCGVAIRHDDDRALYRPGADLVLLPPFEAFDTPRDYYATLAHEAIHWTGHSSRLDRPLSRDFRDPAYAFEELVAELGAAYLCAHLGLETTPREDHASYIQSWVRALEEDDRAILRASTAASAAADYLLALGGRAAGDASERIAA